MIEQGNGRHQVASILADVTLRIVKFRSAIGHDWELFRPYLRWIYYGLFPQRRPSYFTAPWKPPAIPLARAGTMLRSALASGERPAVLFLPMTDWHTRIQRSQHLARALAGLGHSCFYVNPHLGCEYRLPYGLAKESRVAQIEPGIHEIHVHLPAEHAFHRRLLRAEENGRILRTLEQIGVAAPSGSIIQIVNLPIWLDVAVAMRQRYGFPLVYDCHDYLQGFRNLDASISGRENCLFDSADLIAFSGQYLMDRTLAAHPSLRPKSILVRNGVNYAHFARTRKPGKADRVFGYVGALDHWFDVEAVAAAARNHPDSKFLLIGRIEDDRVRRLASLPNVEFTGEVAYAELPNHFARFDVGLIPFLPSELTRAADPIKLYEYFSCGLPVASTRIPEAERYPSLVYLGDGPRGFASAAEEAMKEDDPARREQRIEIARRECWTDRARTLLEPFRWPRNNLPPASSNYARH